MDDPTVAPPPGLGANVFKDRGALERVDEPRINITGMSVTEGNQGNTNLIFTVELDQFTNDLVTVDFTTNNETARGGVDYVIKSGQLSFLPGGATVQQITVEVIGDLIDEDAETFVVNLTAVQNALIITGQGRGTIVDDDGEPTVFITNVSTVEGTILGPPMT